LKAKAKVRVDEMQDQNGNQNQYPQQQPGYPNQQPAPQQGYPAQQAAPQQGAPQGYPAQQGAPQQAYGQMPQQPAPGQATPQTMGADQLRGLFNGLGGSEVGGDARYPNVETPGVYNAVAEAVKVVTSKTDRSKNFLICEYKLVNSSSTLHPEGQMYSWVHNLSNQFYGLPNAKAWLAAVLGFGAQSPEAAALSEEDMIRVVAMPDSIKGRPFSFRCRMHTTKNIDQSTGRAKEVPVLDFAPFNATAEVPRPQAPAPAPMAAPQQGYAPQAMPQQGQAPQQGYPPQAMPQQGAPQQGVPQGYPNNGYQGGN
jgi:hypothetical protein